MQKKAVRVGDCVLDGKHIYIQSMLNTRSDDIAGSVAQAKALEQAGCEILRAAIPDKEALKLIPAIKEAVKIPLVADIHFDYRLALEAVAAGIDKIRINPGNIGGEEKVKAVAEIPATLAEWIGCGKSLPPVSRSKSRFVSGSILAHWKKICLQNMVHQQQKLWWKVPCGTSKCWKIAILPTL